MSPDLQAGEDDVDGVMLDEFDPPAPVPQASHTLMPNALTFAGLQHVISNLCQDVNTSMAHWQEFFKQLKSLESFLRVEDYDGEVVVRGAKSYALLQTLLPDSWAGRASDGGFAFRFNTGSRSAKFGFTGRSDTGAK